MFENPKIHDIINRKSKYHLLWHKGNQYASICSLAEGVLAEKWSDIDINVSSSKLCQIYNVYRNIVVSLKNIFIDRILPCSVQFIKSEIIHLYSFM